MTVPLTNGLSGDIEVDPSEDRGEFEKRMNRMFMRKDHTKEYVEAMMENDLEMQAKCVDEHLKQKASKMNFMNSWDNAKDRDERMQVIGSVKADYEPSAEQIEAIRPKV